MIAVDGLKKEFRVAERPVVGERRRLRRTWVRRRAVDNISFEIADGEIVGFLGPNGAGKTTTLKCLSGLLHPDHGTVTVGGFVPHERRRAFLQSISLVLGQRSSLLWDLPAADAFDLNRTIYRIDAKRFRTVLDELVELLDLAEMLHKPVRTLSLGERMRCELVAALLHTPKVVFLDEPTLGLDVNRQAAIRTFLARYNAEHGASILLTSHYMADVTALAERVLVIDHGRLRFDGDLHELLRSHAPGRIISVTLRAPVDPATWERFGELLEVDALTARLRVARGDTTAVVTRLLHELAVEDVAIEEPPVEEIIAQVFADG